MTLKTCRFVAFLFVALVLTAGLARLFVLPAKMALSGPAYLAIQGVFAGWDLLGIAVACALLSLAVLAWLLRPRIADSRSYGSYSRRSRGPSARNSRPRAFALTIAALLAIIADSVVVGSLAHSVDHVTANWTVLPVDWVALRARWEYAHAAGAMLDLLAFVALVLSVLVTERSVRVRDPDEASGGRGAPLRFMAVR